jgi:hypothetical protein
LVYIQVIMVYGLVWFGLVQFSLWIGLWIGLVYGLVWFTVWFGLRFGLVYGLVWFGLVELSSLDH